MNLALERMDEAKEDAEKALSLDPDFGIGYVQKCYTDYRYAVTKRLVSLINEAMINFEKAFEKFPDCADCYTVYAQVNCLFIDCLSIVQSDIWWTGFSKYRWTSGILIFFTVFRRFWQICKSSRKQTSILLKRISKIQKTRPSWCTEDFCSCNGTEMYWKLSST